MKDNFVHIIDRLGGKELLGFHLSNGDDISASKYLDLYQRQLALGIGAIPKLYLDTKFWGILRDAERGVDGAGAPLLAKIRELVRSNRIVCVCQAATFLEIAKQSKDSLEVVTGLVNELTGSIVIVTEDKLRSIEAANYMRSKAGLPPISDHHIWSKVGLVLLTNVVGHLKDILPNELSEFSTNVVLKSTIDSLWQANLTDIMEAFGWDTANKLSASIDPATISAIEDRKRKRNKEQNSLQEIKRTEFNSIIPTTYKSIFFRAVFQAAIATQRQIVIVDLLNETEQLIQSAIDEALKGQLGQQLPNTYIQTNLYCLYEHDARKKLTSNDWFDMCHASVALPYCDFFFTEKHLSHLICNVLKFDDEYGCTVISSIDEAEEIADSLA